MEKLSITIEQQLDIMERYRLTADECLLVELLFLVFEGEEEPLARWYHLENRESGFLRNLLESLQNKSVLLKSCPLPNPGEPFDYKDLEFNKNFLQFTRKVTGEFGKELFEAYPNEGIIKGKVTPLRNYAAVYKNEEEFFFQYGKSIGWSLTKHKEVLELIKWSIDNDHFGLDMNIARFVGSKMWESIKAHKDGSNCITFDTTTSI